MLVPEFDNLPDCSSAVCFWHVGTYWAMTLLPTIMGRFGAKSRSGQPNLTLRDSGNY